LAAETNGTIHEIDPYNHVGYGLPEGWAWLDDMTPEQAVELLPLIVVRLHRRVEALEKFRRECCDW
jgi:hypothetical protein